MTKQHAIALEVQLAQASSWAELREWSLFTAPDACAAMGHTTALVALRRAGILA